MPKPKGSVKTGGRVAGTQNKLSITVKQSVLDTYVKLQGSDKHSLEKWAEKNLTEFYKIASKLIPTEVTATVTKKIQVGIKPQDG